MAWSLYFTGDESGLTLPAVPCTRVVLDMKPINMSNNEYYISSWNTDISRISGKEQWSTGTVKYNGALKSNKTTFVSSDSRATLDFDFGLTETGAVDIFRRSGNSYSPMEGNVYGVKLYNGNSLVADWDFSNKSLTDKVGGHTITAIKNGSFQSGTGAYIDPFLISTEDDFIGLKNNINITNSQYWFALTNDITLTKPMGKIGNWKTGEQFLANFDGRGHTIRNVNISESADYVGLFGYAKGGTFRNFTIEDSTVKNGYYTGILFGGCYGVTVENVHIKNSLVTHDTSGSTFGGLAGTAEMNGSYGRNKFHNIILENVSVLHRGGGAGGAFGYCYGSDINNFLIINPTISAYHTPYSFAHGISDITVKRLGIYDTASNIVVDGNIPRKILTNPRSIAEYTTGDKTGWGGEYWTFGENKKFNMVEGQLPKITYYGRIEKNPVPISTFTELVAICTDFGHEYYYKGFFKLTNDIIVPSYEAGWNEVKDTFLINGTLQSQIDGDGYWLKNLSYTQGSGTTNQSGYLEVGAFYGLSDATLKNIGIEWTYVSFYGYHKVNCSFNALAYNLSRFKLENVHFKIGDIYNGDSHTMIFPSMRSIVRNSIFEWNGTYDYPQNITYGYNLNDWSMGETSSFEADGLIVSIKNRQSQPPNSALYTGSKDVVKQNIKNVVLYSNGYSNTQTWSGGVKQTGSLADFQNSNYIGYSGFDREVWQLEQGKDPILKVFIKIVNKIEQRLINAYSLISKGAVKRYKGRLNSVVSFSKKYTGKDSRLVKKIYRTLSKALRNVSKVSRKAKVGKVIKSFSRKAISRIPSIFKKKIKQVKGFAKKSFSKLTIKKKITRINKSWSLKMNSKLIKYRDVIRTSTKSFSKNMSSNTLASTISRMLIRVKSFSKPLRSRASYFSNKFNRIKVVVKGYANDIVTSVERKVKRKLIVKSFSEKFRALTQSFFKVASPKNVMAIVTHKFSKISISKRFNKTSTDTKKHKTNINQIDDGGED